MIHDFFGSAISPDTWRLGEPIFVPDPSLIDRSGPSGDFTPLAEFREYFPVQEGLQDFSVSELLNLFRAGEFWDISREYESFAADSQSLASTTFLQGADNPSSGFQTITSEVTTYRNTLDPMLDFEGSASPNLFSVTSSSPLSSIDWGSKVQAPRIDVYFAPYGAVVDGYVSAGWTNYEYAQAMSVLSQIETFADVKFNVTNNKAGAEFRLMTADFGDPTILGLMVPPGEIGAGFAAFNYNGYGWDWAYPGVGGLERGGLGYTTLLHEFGHGLGLAQPHDTGGTSTIMEGVTAPFGSYGTGDLNQGIFTAMSYNVGWATGPAGLPTEYPNYGLEGSYGALDIAVLQQKYGANKTHALGDNTYVIPSANGLTTYFQTIWDAGGTDKIVSNSARDTNIDLRAATLLQEVGGGGYVSYADGIRGGFTIASGVTIENARGGGGNDTIHGNEFGNKLIGAGGRDTLFGGKGNDKLYGGAVGDRLYGGAGRDTLYGGGGSDKLSGGKGNDRLFGGSDNDRLFGDDGNDLLVGNAGRDRMVGGSGDDVLRGGVGGDRLNGGAGEDLLLGGAKLDRMRGGGDDDTMRGGGGGDILLGNNGSDKLRGNAGDDTLNGGRWADILSGGTGGDVFAFSRGSGGDRVTDFDLFEDQIKLSRLNQFADFDAVMAATSDDGTDTLITWDGGSVLLENITSDELTADHFIL